MIEFAADDVRMTINSHTDNCMTTDNLIGDVNKMNSGYKTIVIIVIITCCNNCQSMEQRDVNVLYSTSINRFDYIFNPFGRHFITCWKTTFRQCKNKIKGILKTDNATKQVPSQQIPTFLWLPICECTCGLVKSSFIPGVLTFGSAILCQAHTSTCTESSGSFMAEGPFTLSIRSRCELSGRGDKNRARDGGRVRKKARETDRETMTSVREVWG